MRVTASTDNPNDQGYHHCFEQDETWTLTFEVTTDPSVDSIYFVLWNLHDPVNPKVAELPRDVSVNNGVATIEIGPDRPHLGPGPYCASLTASSPAASGASKGAREIVGNAVYYYDTWKDNPPYKWPV